VNQTSAATNDLQNNAAKTVDSAAAEGKQDVNAASANASGYVDQAKQLAGTALSTAQVC
jgi:hypothetical protein